MRFLSILCTTALIFLFSCNQKNVTLVLPENPHVRITYGADKLQESLEDAGYKITDGQQASGEGQIIVIGKEEEGIVSTVSSADSPGEDGESSKEFFTITTEGNRTIVNGGGASGIMYGLLELSERVQREGRIPSGLSVSDQPEMKLRGACIGLQKMNILPGRREYEYPYTPENFPWFYDKQLWINYLDMLAANRFNSLYLWNGHPFASLVRLKDYPDAVEVDDETFRKNEEIFRFLTREANKRGIWVIQMFYNIIVSKPFAEKHDMVTQDRSRPITPLIADYTRKSIAAFVEKYPNVGLLVALGEAMSGDTTDVKWFTETIIPGVPSC